jgi:aryl-alcohol dehydrogenase-like predicted oxidoreductase
MIGQKAFGMTGHQSSRIIFGAADIWKASPQSCTNTLQLLLKYGVNHIDVAASYGEGRSEESVGLWMKEHRDQFFLATKTNKRTYGEAKEQIASSLKRLAVDYVDMIQMHNLTDPSEWQIAMGPSGALDALVEAREQGLTRFIGVTGHGYYAPTRHLSSIERFPFDSVLLPYNYLLMQNAQYRSNFQELLNQCKRKGIAVKTIKSVARRPWGSPEHTHTCWYEPFSKERDINLVIHWALGCQDVFVVSSSDVTLLPKILNAATVFTKQPDDAEMNELMTDRGCKPIYDGARIIRG